MVHNSLLAGYKRHEFFRTCYYLGSHVRRIRLTFKNLRVNIIDTVFFTVTCFERALCLFGHVLPFSATFLACPTFCCIIFGALRHVDLNSIISLVPPVYHLIVMGYAALPFSWSHSVCAQSGCLSVSIFGLHCFVACGMYISLFWHCHYRSPVLES